MRSETYGFLLNMWIMGRINEDYLTKMVGKGTITQEEYNMIIITPKAV